MGTGFCTATPDSAALIDHAVAGAPPDTSMLVRDRATLNVVTGWDSASVRTNPSGFN
jgi:hypothetical protein